MLSNQQWVYVSIPFDSEWQQLAWELCVDSDGPNNTNDSFRNTTLVHIGVVSFGKQTGASHSPATTCLWTFEAGVRSISCIDSRLYNQRLRDVEFYGQHKPFVLFYVVNEVVPLWMDVNMAQCTVVLWVKMPAIIARKFSCARSLVRFAACEKSQRGLTPWCHLFGPRTTIHWIRPPVVVLANESSSLHNNENPTTIFSSL